MTRRLVMPDGNTRTFTILTPRPAHVWECVDVPGNVIDSIGTSTPLPTPQGSASEPAGGKPT